MISNASESGDPALLKLCTDVIQLLSQQNKEFSLDVKVGNFNFSVDTRGTRNPVLLDRPRKKKSQSTLRRDKLRLNRYLEMKRIRRASATTPQSSVTEKSSSESPGSMDHDKHKAGHKELDLSHNKKLKAVFALFEHAYIAAIDTKKLIRDIDRGLQQMSTEMETIDRMARALSFPSHDSFS